MTQEEEFVEAAANGNMEQMQQMLNDWHPHVHINSKVDGNTALIQAAKNGHAHAIIWLIEHGARINATNNLGRSALRMAASGGYLDICQILCEHGAEVDSKSFAGFTPLYAVCKLIGL